VQAADGASYNSPQTVLDKLVGRLSFDPLDFTRLSPREQVATLLDMVELDVDLDQLARDRQRIYDDRTEVGRQRKMFEGQAAGAGAMEKAPEQEVDAQELVMQYQSAVAAKADYERLLSRISVWQDSIEQLREDLANAQTNLAVLIGERDAMPPTLDLNALQDEIANAEETNRAVRRNDQRAAVAQAVGDVREQWDTLTANIEAIDTARTEALAKAKFPVPGLGFDDDGVAYNGIPFSQASSSEQIRVSLAMAMALNPTLRVIRILDGSLLDEDNLELIAQQAALEDYQVWIERVADGSGVGVVIEDGAVVPDDPTDRDI
jgi:DNA repair exonuclease SbcCD ATPase subunit